jgi:16S rRNA (cytidine1402-2'-O)-methyltransferase
VSNQHGTLYVVATPIGNLDDLSVRAARVLGEVALIAAEDTRHTGKLLARYQLATPLISLHEHNESERTTELLARLTRGESLALVSDAGTPLISDPGYQLVRAARAAGLRVEAVPGPCAAVAALSVSGLAPDRFVFEGFLPARHGARRERLELLRNETRTLIFYESPHRIVETLDDMASVFGDTRNAVLARELTKQFETVLGGTLGEIAARVRAEPDQQRGEMVILVSGVAGPPGTQDDASAARIARILARELPPAKAAALAAEITGVKKSTIYQTLLQDR